MAQAPDGVSIVQAFFQALLSGRLEAGLELISPQAVWRYHGPESLLPFAGAFNGPAGVRRFFETALQHVEILNMRIDAIEAADGALYIRGQERSRVRANGALYDIPWLHRVVVQDGRIVSYDEYLDTAAVAAALAA
ncbi:MAG TPA: nuclear transport factor 2 family protein [Caulobacteraceae bacterium]|nr:nuclear transport factor 2 family protein [Caulobacteraceae bacterium]